MITHVTLNTRNLNDSIAFYEKYIGLKIVGDLRLNGMPIVFMAADEADQTQLELIQSDEPFTGSGISIGFASAGLEEKREVFSKEGLKVSDIISPKPGVKFFFVKDPDGFSVQIMSE